MTEAYFTNARAVGSLTERRRLQAVQWMHALIAESLKSRFYASEDVKARLPALEAAVADGRMPVLAAALALLGG